MLRNKCMVASSEITDLWHFVVVSQSWKSNNKLRWWSESDDLKIMWDSDNPILLPSRNPSKSSKPAGVGPARGHLTSLGENHASPSAPWACYKNPVYRDHGLSLRETGQHFGCSLQKEKLLPLWSSLAEASTHHPLPCNLPSPALFQGLLLLVAVTLWLVYVSVLWWLIWPLNSLCGAHPSFPLLPRASSPKLMHTDSSLRPQQPLLMWATAGKLLSLFKPIVLWWSLYTKIAPILSVQFNEFWQMYIHPCKCHPIRK